jgi:hypothetical protein
MALTSRGTCEHAFISCRQWWTLQIAVLNPVSHKRTPTHTPTQRKAISLSLIGGNTRKMKRFVGCVAREVGENFQQGINMPALVV